MPANSATVFALLLIGCAVLSKASVVSPVGKVVELLKKLGEQISSEGAKEAAQYDRYACFCKEQAGYKVAAIEKSGQKIEELAAEITEVETTIADLNADIEKLTKRVTELEGEIKDATAKREKEHADYIVEEKDMSDAVSALTRAIEALRESKKGMSNAKLNFLELRDIQSLVARAFQTVARSSVVVQETNAQLQEKLKALTADPAPTEKKYAAQHVYEYRSNDIIATLQGLLKTFKKDKKELDENEMQLRDAFDEKVQGLNNERTFAVKEQSEKEDAASVKTDQLHTAEGDKTAETTAKESDEEFQTSLTESCEKKGKAWDERSKMRAEELTILAEASAVLEGSVERQYASIKKAPVGLINSHKAVPQKAVITAAAKDLAADFVHEGDVDTEASFLQVQQLSADIVSRKLLTLLQGQAKRLNSNLLASLAFRLNLNSGVAIDHFVRVRSLIKDLMERLKADAEEEATTKSFCDKEMKKSTADRDEAQLKVETLAAEIALKTAELEELSEEIVALQKAIAELNKALFEAEEIRAKEKASNEKVIADAVAGKESVAQAIKILKNFWDQQGGGFLQVKTVYKPPNSDREGKTVGDRAPEIFEGDYQGSEGNKASGGILGILDLILKDFEHAETQVAKDEKAAKEDFDKFKTDTTEDIDTKTKEKESKESKVITLKDEIKTAQEESIDAGKAKDSALEALEKLSAMCVATETSEERKEKREQEIEALKQAMQILNDWKN